jgi:hypothetical protein
MGRSHDEIKIICPVRKSIARDDDHFPTPAVKIPMNIEPEETKRSSASFTVIHSGNIS